MNDSVAKDILIGANAIARFMGLSRRKIYHLVENGVLPVFRLGSTVCARKSRLLLWIEEQEAGRPNRAIGE